MNSEDAAKVRSYLAQLRAEGLEESEIARRMAMASFPSDEVKDLLPGASLDSGAVRPPQAVGLTSQPEDVRELAADVKEFLDKAMPVLWDQHRPFQYQTLCDLKTFHYRLQEALKHGPKTGS